MEKGKVRLAPLWPIWAIVILASTAFPILNFGQDTSSNSDSAFPTEMPAVAPRPLSLEELGDLAMARRSFADGVDFYRKAMKVHNANLPVLWNKLGIAYQRQGDHGAARKAYRQAIKLRPDFAEAWNNEGSTYYADRKYRRSVKYYRRAIALNPHVATFHLNLGFAYYYLKNFKLAIDSFRTALQMDPQALSSQSTPVASTMHVRQVDAEYFFYMAKVWASLDQPEEAVRYLRRAFEDGFKDMKRLDQDPDIQKLADYPPFVELRRNPPASISP